MADLAQRMKDAGMMSIDEMLEKSPLGKFNAHAGVTDLESFEEWIQIEGLVSVHERRSNDEKRRVFPVC